MRYGHTLPNHPCPKKCGCTDMLVYTYCCSETADVVCTKCNAVKVIKNRVGRKTKKEPYGKSNPIIERAYKEGKAVSAEIGFLGKEQCFFPTIKVL